MSIDSYYNLNKTSLKIYQCRLTTYINKTILEGERND